MVADKNKINKAIEQVLDTKALIIEEARKQKISPEYALANAFQESSFKHDAQPISKKTGKPLSSAYGLFQFTDAAWKDYGITPGSKETRDPKVQAHLGVKRIKQAVEGLRDTLGREPTPGELYISHVFGPRGGKIIAGANPKESVLSVLSKAHKSPQKAANALGRNAWINKNGLSNVGQLKAYMEKKTASNMQMVAKYVEKHAAGNMPVTGSISVDKFTGEGQADQSNDSLSGGSNRAEDDEGEDGSPEHLFKASYTPEEMVTTQDREQTLTEEGGDLDIPPTPPTSIDTFEVTKEGDVIRNSQYDKDRRAVAPEYDPRQTGYKKPGEVSVDDFIQGKEHEVGNPSLNPLPKDTTTPSLRPKDSNVTPYKPLNVEQQRILDKQQEEDTTGVWDATVTSVKRDWGISRILDQEYGHLYDENWNIEPDWIKQYASKIPNKYLDQLDSSLSEDHAKAIVKRIERAIELDKELAKASIPGHIARFAVNIIDPTAWPVIAATGGLGLYSKISSLSSKGHRILAGGTVAGVESAAVEGILYSQNPTGTIDEIVYAGLGGLALGAGASAFIKGPKLSKESQDMIEAATKGQKELDRIRGNPSLSASGIKAKYDPINKSSDDLFEEIYDTPTSAMSLARYDVVGRLGASNNPIARRLGQKLGQDSVGRSDGSVVEEAATEYQSQLSRSMQAKHDSVFQAQLKKWTKEKGYKRWQFMAARNDFSKQVNEAMNDVNGFGRYDPEVQAVAKNTQRLYDEYLHRAQNPGLEDGFIVNPVAGFDNVKPNGRPYTPRIKDEKQWRLHLEKYGEDKIVTLFSKAFRAVDPDLDEAIADKVAKSYVRTQKEAMVQDGDLARKLAGDDMAGLRHLLVTEGGLPEEVWTQFYKRFTAKDEKAGKHTRAKSKQLMDQNFTAWITDDSGQSVKVSVGDLFVNDSQALFRIYNRQMSGAIALARQGIHSKAQLEADIRKVKDTADKTPNYDSKALDADVQRLEFLGTMITGAPVGKFGKDLFASRNSRFGEVSKMVRDWNFIRLMNQMGPTQLAEIGNILGIAGWKTALSNMPALRALQRDALNGQLNDDLQRELEAIFGIGSDRLRNTSIFRHDDFGDFIDPVAGELTHKIQGGLEVGKQITAEISGMNGVNMYLQRWAVRAVSQKLANAAKGSIKGWSERRLAQAGLTKEDVSDIAAEMKKHSTLEKGVLTNQKLTQLNLDKWDRHVAYKYKTSVNRISTQIIQENDPGNMAMWMSKPLGQIIGQFRTFMFVAHSKQLLHGLNSRDIATGMAFLTSSITAGMAYTLQRGVMSIGRPDAEEYREKYLSSEAIGKASFARAGWASMVPWAMDQALWLTGNDPMFDVRASGLSPSGFLQNPSTQLVNNTREVLGSILGSSLSSDRDFTEKDMNRLLNTVVPFSNALGVQQFNKNLSSAFPD